MSLRIESRQTTEALVCLSNLKIEHPCIKLGEAVGQLAVLKQNTADPAGPADPVGPSEALEAAPEESSDKVARYKEDVKELVDAVGYVSENLKIRPDGKDPFTDGTMDPQEVGVRLKAAIEALVLLSVKTTLIAELMGAGRGDLRKLVSGIFNRIRDVMGESNAGATDDRNVDAHLRAFVEVERDLLPAALNLMYTKSTWSVTPGEALVLAKYYLNNLMTAIDKQIRADFSDKASEWIIKNHSDASPDPMQESELAIWYLGNEQRKTSAVIHAQEHYVSVLALKKVIDLYEQRLAKKASGKP